MQFNLKAMSFSNDRNVTYIKYFCDLCDGILSTEKHFCLLIFFVPNVNWHIFTKQNDKTMLFECNCRYSYLILSLLSLSLPKHNVEVADQEKKNSRWLEVMSVVMETESVRSGRSERSERSQGSRHQRPHRSHSGGRDSHRDRYKQMYGLRFKHYLQ